MERDAETRNLKEKIGNITEASIEVIKDASLLNGAIVAANTDREDYPREASPYRFVWVRDASFTCVAADILGIEGVQERFFRWCLRRAERYNGVFLEKYHTHGMRAGNQIQPDQTGTLLWAIWHHYHRKKHIIKHSDSSDRSKMEEIRHVRRENDKNSEMASDIATLVVESADGICSLWNRTHFIVPTHDLWEERSTFPDIEDNHTYSLAACAFGLRCAVEIMKEDTDERNRLSHWKKCAIEMEKQISHAYDPDIGYFRRTFGKISDSTVDASLLGLCFPFEICSPHDERMKNTVHAIESRLVFSQGSLSGGVRRYENDAYDGWVREGILRRKGAGAWPILNFWMSIYYAMSGDEKKAMKYYKWVIERVEKYIPEQIFDNEFQCAVCPLVWSHAMFAIASDFLRILR